MINTAGGLTGGDRFNTDIRLHQDSELFLTTQAAERAYRARSGHARVTTRITVDQGAMAHWLPQEMILFDGCKLRRSLRVDLAPTARLLMVEPLVFGRTAMGESLNTAEFSDSILIYRQGHPIYLDRVDLRGTVAHRLARTAVTNGGAAVASLLYVAPDAEAHLAPIRTTLPKTAGVSLLAPDILVLRIVATDSFAMRQTLIPVIERLTVDRLPRSWRL